ncbi:MAG TPA: hypothetical protein VFI70_09965 [Nitrososphaeraceae archaeon]|nr:hypothetical protein [Nitrososphaeraceae archaeon]
MERVVVALRLKEMILAAVAVVEVAAVEEVVLLEAVALVTVIKMVILLGLKPSDNSAFKISLFGLSSADTVDHYTVMPGGTPR